GKLSKLPTGWATLVANVESLTGLPMAAGNYPQLVRDWLPLVKSDNFSKTLKSNAPATDVAGLTTWVGTCAKSDDPAHRLLAAGLLRLAKRFDEAEKMLQSKSPAKEWKTAFANEEAALAWQRGNYAAARKTWAKLPDSAATHFNRGMCELFSDNAAEAIPHLK